MCVRRQDRQRARSGRSRAVAPPSSRITRSRPCPPPGQPAHAAGRAGQPPARQIGRGGSGIGAQQHGRPSRSRRPRCRGPGTARQGELVLQPARPGGVPQPRPPRTSGNDTVNTGANPGTASASTSCRMLTVSSRTKTGTGRPTQIGVLTPDDAGPLPRAHKEARNSCEDVAFAVEGCTGWRYVVEELAPAGVAAHLAGLADTAFAREPSARIFMAAGRGPRLRRGRDSGSPPSPAPGGWARWRSACAWTWRTSGWLSSHSVTAATASLP
jgi:hypothetical protein